MTILMPTSQAVCPQSMTTPELTMRMPKKMVDAVSKVIGKTMMILIAQLAYFFTDSILERVLLQKWKKGCEALEH